MIVYSDATLKRKLRLDEILRCLADYRDADWIPTQSERDRCAAMLDVDASPADVAEMVQAAGYPQP